MCVFHLVQASTGDGWSDIVLSLYGDVGSATANVGISFYFISFMLIVALILMQVVIAVLLEEFSKVSDAESKNQDTEDVANHFSLRPNPFEAFFDDLNICRDEDSQVFKIVQLWKKISSSQNVTEDGRMGYSEVAKGLRLLRVRPPALMTPSDWNDMAVDTEICDSNYMIDKQGFVQIVQASVRAHLISELTKCMYVKVWEENSIKAMLLATRTCLQDQQRNEAFRDAEGRTSLLPPGQKVSGSQEILKIQEQILKEVKDISTRMSKIESEVTDFHSKLDEHSGVLKAKSVDQPRSVSPSLSEQYPNAQGAILSKELPSSSRSSPVDGAYTNVGGLNRLLQMELKKKEGELHRQSEDILKRMAESEQREEEMISKFTSLLDQKDADAARSNKEADDLRQELSLRNAKEASAQALHREEMDAMRRDIEAMRQQQTQKIRLPDPTAESQLETTESMARKPETKTDPGAPVGGIAALALPTALVAKHPSASKPVQQETKVDQLTTTRGSRTKSSTSTPQASPPEICLSPDFDKLPIPQQSRNLTEPSRALSQDMDSHVRESQEVHDKLRELLHLKREINAFDRSREPAGSGQLQSPVTNMSARGSTSFPNDALWGVTKLPAPRPQHSEISTEKANGLVAPQVSITSPMQPPPDISDRAGRLSMPLSRSSPPATTISTDPNIHSSFLRILGVNSSEGPSRLWRTFVNYLHVTYSRVPCNECA